jgi:hypothetical protein
LDEEFKLYISDGDEPDYFGGSVSINGDYAIIGARNANNYYGAAYIFKNEDGTWILKAELNETEDLPYGNGFGTSVSINGNYAIVGAPNNNSVFIYNKNGSLWEKEALLNRSGNFGI